MTVEEAQSAPDAAPETTTQDAPEIDAGQVAGTDPAATASDASIPEEAPDRSFEEMLAEGQNAGESPAADPPATPPTDRQDALLAEVAKDMGLSPEKIAAAKQAGILPDLVAINDRKIFAELQEQRGKQQEQQQAQQASEQQRPASQQAAPEQAPKFSFDWKDEDGQEIHPTIRKNVEGLYGQFQGDIGTLRQQVGEVFKQVVVPLQKDLQGLADMLAQERVDNLFAKLGPEWADTFGAGDPSELAPDSSQAKNRSKLVDTAAAIVHWEKTKGRTAKLDGKLFQRALAATFADQLTSKARKQVISETEQARRQRSHPPTQRRTTSHLTGDERAYRAASEAMAKVGLVDEDAQ